MAQQAHKEHIAGKCQTSLVAAQLPQTKIMLYYIF
jgi:hypothetical protein